MTDSLVTVVILPDENLTTPTTVGVGQGACPAKKGFGRVGEN